jgi:hypothetical protein
LCYKDNMTFTTAINCHHSILRINSALFTSLRRNRTPVNISLTFHEQILCIVQDSLVCELQVLPVSQWPLPMGAHASCSCDQIQEAMSCLNVTHSCSHKTEQACASHTRQAMNHHRMAGTALLTVEVQRLWHKTQKWSRGCWERTETKETEYVTQETEVLKFLIVLNACHFSGEISLLCSIYNRICIISQSNTTFH